MEITFQIHFLYLDRGPRHRPARHHVSRRTNVLVRRRPELGVRVPNGEGLRQVPLPPLLLPHLGHHPALAHQHPLRGHVDATVARRPRLSHFGRVQVS